MVRGLVSLLILLPLLLPQGPCTCRAQAAPVCEEHRCCHDEGPDVATPAAPSRPCHPGGHVPGCPTLRAAPPLVTTKTEEPVRGDDTALAGFAHLAPTAADVLHQTFENSPAQSPSSRPLHLTLCVQRD
jgi:hypothetical protein